MEHLELTVLGLLALISALAVLARFVSVPYPILLLVGGLGVGFVPGVPDVELAPELVLLLFLPPLLYVSAFFSSLRELRRNVRPIGMLAIGLVIATTLIVAVAAHFLVGLPWGVAFVLGAIVSPTDPVAPATIVRRLGVPRRVVTVIEGENLTNDWTALVVYRFAVVAVVTGSFSLVDAGLRFVLTGVGGVAIGLATGWLVAQVRRRLDDPPTEITISILTAYLAYIPAEELGVSGVLAAVTVGVYLGWRSHELVKPSTRIQVTSFWEVLQFLLNAILFVLVGLQLPGIVANLSGESPGQLIGYGVLIGATVIVVRVVWVYVLTYLPRALSRRLRERDPYPSPRVVGVIAWSGMRGAVSLAAALAIPLTVDGGGPFPERDLVIFLAFCVILATLLLQGLTLPPLIRLLGVTDDGLAEQEEIGARHETARAALARIDELAGEDWVYDGTAERARGMFDYRRRRFASRLDEDDDGGYEERSDAYQRFLLEVLAAQRAALLELRNDGTISDEVMRAVQRDLDLEESRLELTR